MTDKDLTLGVRMVRMYNTHEHDVDNYPSFVRSLFRDIDNGGQLDLVHAVLGISGEAGELVDAVKKHFAYGAQLDVENMVEELGDLLFYAQTLMNLLRVPRTQITAYNVHKLRKRYPKGEFTSEDAVTRADKQMELPLEGTNNG